MNKAYVSEFSIFMKHYLEDHPDIVEKQKAGWKFYWGSQIIPLINRQPESEEPSGKR